MRKIRGRIQMSRLRHLIIVLSILLFFTTPAIGRDPIVYPAKGQSQEQMEKDKLDCNTWARNQTGFDPMKTPTASSPPPSDPGTSASPMRGAAGGALAGLAIGSLSGNTGKGAAIGAASGGLVGGMRRREHQKRQLQREQQWAQQQAAEYYRERDSYNRAFAACLESKGYTVR
jgi:hypothetical protein